VKAYGYDANDRLTSVCLQALCPDRRDPSIRYTYDPVGNRLSEATPKGATGYSYNAGDELTRAGSTSYGYDANGNQTRAGSDTFAYDLADRLVSVASGKTTTTHGYDGDGNRLTATTSDKKTVNTTRYVWDTVGGLPQLALERDATGSLLRRYVYGARRISITTPDATSYYAYDSLGSVANVISAAGATQRTYAYEPFGTTTTETKNDKKAPDNPMKFTGELYDPTGLYYLRARQYDPTTGRFLALDPVESSGSGSGYAYAANRPTVMVDPSGQTLVPSNAGPAAAAAASSPVAPPPLPNSKKSSDPLYRQLAVALSSADTNPWRDGRFQELRLPRAVPTFHAYGGGAQRVGRWVTPERISTPAEFRSRLALPPSNTARNITAVKIPAGTKIIGIAAENFGQPGGGLQIEIVSELDESWFAKGTRFIYGWWARLGVAEPPPPSRGRP